MEAGSQAAWPSDAELVERILSGSHEHFDLLYDAYFHRVYLFALKRLRDRADAEDVAQDVFMTVLGALPSFRGQSSLLVWIFGITRNTVNRRFRKPRPFAELIDSSEGRNIAAPEASLEESLEVRRVLERCSEVLSEDLNETQKQIFRLRHLNRLSIRALAEVMEKSEGAIKSNLYRVRQLIGDRIPGLELLLRS